MFNWRWFRAKNSFSSWSSNARVLLGRYKLSVATWQHTGSGRTNSSVWFPSSVTKEWILSIPTSCRSTERSASIMHASSSRTSTKTARWNICLRNLVPLVNSWGSVIWNKLRLDCSTCTSRSGVTIDYRSGTSSTTKTGNCSWMLCLRLRSRFPSRKLRLGTCTFTLRSF